MKHNSSQFSNKKLLSAFVLLLICILSACSSPAQAPTSRKLSEGLPLLISSNSDDAKTAMRKLKEPETRVRMTYSGAIYLRDYSKAKAVNFPLTVTPPGLYTKKIKVDDFWYANSDSTHSKYLVNSDGRAIGMFTSSANTGLSFALDPDGDRRVDLMIKLSPDFKEDVLIATELGQSLLRKIIKGGFPCGLAGGAKTDARVSFDLCSPMDAGSGGSTGKGSPEARPFDPFGNFGSMGDTLCGDHSGSGYGPVSGDGDSMVERAANFIKEVINNGFDGERDGGAARAARAIVSPPFVAVLLLNAYGYDQIITNPIENPSVWDAANPVAWVAVAVKAATGDDAPEAPDTGTDTDDNTDDDTDTDTPDTPDQPQPDNDNDASQPGPDEHNDLDEYCEARNKARNWWYQQTHPDGYASTDCDEAVVNPNPAAKGDTPIHVSCKGTTEDFSPTRPAAHEQQCNRVGSSSILGTCPGVPNSPGATLWYGIGDTLMVEFDPANCPQEICQGRPQF